MSNRLIRWVTSLAIFAVALTRTVSTTDGSRQAFACSATYTNYDTIIIGTGISGLAAVVELHQKLGIKNIAILEARDRLGGRILTTREGSSFIEQGAQFIHGQNGNTAYEFARQRNLVVPELEINGEDSEYYDTNGNTISDSIAEAVEEQYQTIRDQITERANYGQSVGTQLKNDFERWIQGQSSTSQKRAVFNQLYWDEANDVGDDLEYLNLEQDEEFEDASGNQEQPVRNGWYSVIEALTANLPISQLFRFNSPVTSIDYSNPCQVVVQAYGAVFTAKTVIATLPLGVLKAGTVQFVPALPPTKIAAIQHLGFGCVTKLFVFYDAGRWWQPEVESMNVLFVPGEPDRIQVNPSMYASPNDHQWYRNLVAFNTVYGHPNVLQAWAAGHWAAVLESLPSSEVSSVVGQILRQSLGREYSGDLPNAPTRIFRTNWCLDPYSKGSYSYLAMGSHVSDLEELGKALPENGLKRLFFAGEATNAERWSTVNGAWDTGVLAANAAAESVRSL